MTIGVGAVLSTVPSVVIRTFFRHYFRHAEQLKERRARPPTRSTSLSRRSEARREFTYDEAFWVVKAFLEKATSYTVEEVQSFCNTQIPHPPWVTVVPVVIPAETSAVAARVIVEHLGEDECDRVAGGQTWWQRRARADGGVEAEWICMRKDWDGEDVREDGRESRRMRHRGKFKSAAEMKKQTTSERKVPPQYTPDMDESPRTMLYIHAECCPLRFELRLTPSRRRPLRLQPQHPPCAALFGGRTRAKHAGYAIWRYARKMGGRAFGVTYRLSPQYPWPCALQDCLAAYLFLIRPPPSAKHAPVDPKRIIFAGDSAGGGLALALMCLVRDMKLPAPACGVLISPWVDLTHSFPSILQNTATDIIMPYGFIHKPSSLWPPPDSEARQQIDAMMLEHQRDGAPHDLSAEVAHKVATEHKRAIGKKGKKRAEMTASARTSGTTTPLTAQDGGVQDLDAKGGKPLTDQVSKPEESGREGAADAAIEKRADDRDAGKNPNEETKMSPKGQGKSLAEVTDGDRAEPGAVVHITVDGQPVEVKEQIQLYATNAQLTHPLVSPALQPSLGGLPPLLIIAGEKEVLRDEILYVAHRAAHPDRYPLRDELKRQHQRYTDTAEREGYGPTKVHLQVYDGACHVIPMFSFTSPAKYSFRAIASFCVAETSKPTGSPANGAPLELRDSPTADDAGKPLAEPKAVSDSATVPGAGASAAVKPALKVDTGKPIEKSPSASRRFTLFGPRSPAESPASSSSFTDPRSRTLKRRDLKRLGETVYTETKPENRPEWRDNMIRERVGVTGVVRPLEAESEIPALQLKPDEIGVIKEGPVKRYLEGKRIWDKRYAKAYERIKRERAKNVKRAQQEETSRLQTRLRKVSSRKSDKADAAARKDAGIDDDNLPADGRVWDLKGERPPPSSIAARKDVGEALRLAKVVDDQRESQTHPLALWANLNDIKWLTHESDKKHDRDAAERDGRNGVDK